MQSKSLLEHMMAEFGTRAKKTTKKVKRAMAGRPAKKTKSSAGRKAVGKNKSAKKVAKETTRRRRRCVPRRPGSLPARDPERAPAAPRRVGEGAHLLFGRWWICFGGWRWLGGLGGGCGTPWAPRFERTQMPKNQ
jgi:hypothetical protein